MLRGFQFCTLLWASFCSVLAVGVSPIVHTPLGILQGTLDGPAEGFFGVRYAQQPERFGKSQVDQTPWPGTRSAERRAPSCWEPSDFPCISSNPSLDCKSANASNMSEDCLFLDIWRPLGTNNGSAPKAVMVWIHGGGMTMGSSADHTGASLAANQDVLVVSINYRLGPLGFLPLWNFGTADHGSGGMNGIHDQIVALRWIKEMISSFGGDAGNTTIFGCSAGGLSVCTLSVSPLASGLFQRAISQSGPCIGPWGPGTHEHGQQVAARVMAQLHVKTVAELRQLAPWELQWAQGVDQYDVEFPGYWVDGWVAPVSPAERIKAGSFWNPTSILIGGSSRDGLVDSYAPASLMPTDSSHYPTLMKQHWRPQNESGGLQATVRTLPRAVGAEVVQAYPLDRFDQQGGGPAGAFKAADGDYNVVCPMVDTANRAVTAGIQTFVYYFVHGPWHQAGCDKPSTGRHPVTHGWANHGSEQVFVFGESNASDACKFDKSEEELSSAMQSFWATFAKTGKPTASVASLRGSIHWPLYTVGTGLAMRLETGSGLAQIKNFGTAPALQAGETVNCDFWFNLTRSSNTSRSHTSNLPDSSGGLTETVSAFV